MIGLVNNFAPKTGIGKYSFNLFEKAKNLTEIEMVYLESKDNKIPETKKVKKVVQSFNLPVFNKSFSWYYFFPLRIPEGYSLYHLSSQYLARIVEFKSPCIVTHMDLAPIIFPKEYPFITRFLLKKVLPFYKKMEKILTISESAKKELIEKGFADEDKVTAISLGFDENIFKPINKESARKKLGLPLQRKIILNVGSEEPRKNIPCLLSICSELEKESKETMLIRVGNRNSQYDSQKKKLNIKEFNKIPEEQLSLFYSAADLFFFPATYEGGFAYPPLEAMACGTPTIVGNELELFGEGAKVIDVSDYGKLLDSAKKILFDEKEAKKMSIKALNASKEFTLDKEAKKTVNVYKEVLGIK